MKTHQEISSSRRKCRKAHFTAPSHVRYRLMRATLAKNLRKTYNVRTMPVKKNDEVSVIKGNFKGTKGKVTQVYRKRWCIHIEKLSKTKANGAPVQIPIRPSQCAITKMNLEQDRKDLIKRKAFTLDKKKGKADKYTAQQID